MEPGAPESSPATAPLIVTAAASPRRQRLAAALELALAELAASPSAELRDRVRDLERALLDERADCSDCDGDGAVDSGAASNRGPYGTIWTVQCDTCRGSGRADSIRFECALCSEYVYQPDADVIGTQIACEQCIEDGR